MTSVQALNRRFANLFVKVSINKLSHLNVSEFLPEPSTGNELDFEIRRPGKVLLG